MDSRTAEQFKHVLNTDVVRRLLIRYFVSKGFTESFDRVLYPGLIQDLPWAIPVLVNHVEVVPHARQVDVISGKAELGWNLFALGSHRMFLGQTYHHDLKDLARQITAGQIVPTESLLAAARRQATPRQVIAFLTRVLGGHEGGYIDLAPPSKQLGWVASGRFGPTMGGRAYGRGYGL